MAVNKFSWETVPFDNPDLELVIEREKPTYLTPGKRPNEKLSITVRSVPADVMDMIWYLKQTVPAVETISFAEGCLVHCGLGVIEHVFESSPKGRQSRLEAIKTDNVDARYRYIQRRYTFVHLGSLKASVVTVFCLSENDRARIMEISRTYGLSPGQVVILAMAVGIAQSTSALPKEFKERAEKEMKRFAEWVEGS